jgi:two-component system cell cycle response regulator DivK
MARKILVVEDNPDCREMLVLLFQHEGYYVIAAKDGREGLRLAREESPELIITDLHMPHLSGVELIAQLRSLSGFENTPILAMTAYDSREESRAIEAGASFSVMKPVSIEDLFDHVARLLQSDGPSTGSNGFSNYSEW